ncbi:hypothetical protein GEMRC1_008426 [Eukaryota sp. GEM-RC1]
MLALKPSYCYIHEGYLYTVSENTSSLHRPPSMDSLHIDSPFSPRSYDINLFLNYDDPSFVIELTLLGYLSAPATQLSFHSVGHTFNLPNCCITPTGGHKVPVIDVVSSTSSQTVTFVFASEIPPSVSKLTLSYSGPITSNMCGIYTSPQSERFQILTQFEPCDSRKLLVSLDQPNVKQIFSLTIHNIPKSFTALSNTEILKTTVKGQVKSVSFCKTLPLPTYLFAFFVGLVDQISCHSDSGVLVSVYSPCGKSEWGKFALEVATRALDFFSDYFDYTYPYSKIDHVAVDYFAAGAMENQGLAIYRSSRLLYSQDLPLQDKIGIARVVAHETVHMWFGNLVTLSSWDELYLNEGFARLMEYFCVSELYPEFRQNLNYLLECREAALYADGFYTSRPLKTSLSSVEEVDSIFDPISYSKGSMLLRMIQLLNPDWKTNLHQYLKKFEFSNVFGRDLFEILKYSHHHHHFLPKYDLIVDEILKTRGFPLISVNNVHFDMQHRHVKFTLEQFEYHNFSNISIPTQRTIPISVSTSSSLENPSFLMLNQKSQEFIIDFNPLDRHQNSLIFNIDSVSFCRFLYSESRSFFRILNLIELQSLPISFIISFILDLVSTSQSFHSSLGELFLAIVTASKYTDLFIWRVIEKSIEVFQNLKSEKVNHLILTEVIEPTYFKLFPGGRIDFENLPKSNCEMLAMIIRIAHKLGSTFYS